MEFNATTLFYDFALAAMLLFVGKVIRAKCRPIQKLYVPSALIAGFLGLFLGEQFLGILPFSTEIANYPSILIAVLFGTMFLGNREKTSFKSIMGRVGDTILVNGAADCLQFGFFILVGILVLPLLFPGINEAFGLLLPAGFYGGHGTAAAIGTTLAEAGWEDATTIAQTFATIGLLGGVLLGVLLINIGARKGYTRVIKSVDELPQEMLTGLVPPDEAPSIGKSTTSGMSMDSLTWHLCLVFMSVGLAYVVDALLKAVIPQITFPVYAIALLCGIVIQLVVRLLKLDAYVDKGVITHIGSSASDLLVFFGVASIKVAVVARYWVPIVLLAVLGLALVVLYFTLSPKFFKSYWFERGIYIFGMSTGVLATGVILLRICDPEFRTGVLEDFGLAWIVLSILDAVVVALSPMFVVAGGAIAYSVVLLAVGLAALFVCRRLYVYAQR